MYMYVCVLGHDLPFVLMVLFVAAGDDPLLSAP